MDERTLIALLAAILKAGSQVLDTDCRLDSDEAVRHADALLDATNKHLRSY